MTHLDADTSRKIERTKRKGKERKGKFHGFFLGTKECDRPENMERKSTLSKL